VDRFALAICGAQELVAAAKMINFRYEDGITSLSWAFGTDISPFVWIALFLVLVTLINMAPVKVISPAAVLPLASSQLE
jgi:amino acid transporter